MGTPQRQLRLGEPPPTAKSFRIRVLVKYWTSPIDMFVDPLEKSFFMLRHILCFQIYSSIIYALVSLVLIDTNVLKTRSSRVTMVRLVDIMMYNPTIIPGLNSWSTKFAILLINTHIYRMFLIICNAINCIYSYLNVPNKYIIIYTHAIHHEYITFLALVSFKCLNAGLIQISGYM